MTPLSQKFWDQRLPQLEILTYDRSCLQQGIVHIGVGGFHRSHQAYYMHQLLKQGKGADWTICGMGIRPEDQGIFEALKSQDGLYSLITRHPDGQIDTEIIGAITQFIWAYLDPENALEKLASEHIKIVSLTITEGGYNFDANTGDFDFSHPDIQFDLAKPEKPKTVFGFIVEALRRRMLNGIRSFTILSCDNIQHNGTIAQKMFFAFAEKQDPLVYEWMVENTVFPNTMVDRITPLTTKEDTDYLETNHSIKDLWPVTCEPFIQWIVEDQFPSGRPPLEEVGVQFVSDVKPYEKMKLRLLNAGHSVLGIPGALFGHPTIYACMEDTVFVQFMRSFMDEEATPTLDPLPDVDLTTYKDSLQTRFANPTIKDSVDRICSESSTKLPVFLIETIAENIKHKGQFKRSALVIASWYVYHKYGVNEQKKALVIMDNQASVLKKNTQNPIQFLSLSSIFGSIGSAPEFTELYTKAVQKLESGNSIRELMIQTL